MRRNFYFKTQAEIVSGSARFAAIVAAEHASLGITPEQAADYVACDALLQSAYVTGTRPVTRTSVAVSEKNDAIKRVPRSTASGGDHLRSAGGRCKLIASGLLPRTTYTRRALSTEPPVVQVISVVGRVVRIRLRGQSLEGGRRAIGAMGAQVYSHVGEQAPEDPRAYHHEGLATRETFQIVFPNSVPGGATAWVCAAWVSHRGVTVTGSVPISLTIQGGPVVMDAA